MACNPDFVQFIIDQCSGAGEIAVKKMMGDYCAYCDGVLFGLICDNNLYVKVTEPGRAVLKEVISRPPLRQRHRAFFASCEKLPQNYPRGICRQIFEPPQNVGTL